LADSGQDNWIEKTIVDYESPLLRYALHFVRDADTARDIVQDAFLQLCRNQKPELRERMPQWLYTVCRNRAIDLIRKERRVKQMPERDENSSRSVALDPVDPSANPGQVIEAAEAATGLMKQIETLPDRQQEVLRLKFHGGLSYKEIAEVMDLTSTNVGFILHTAISKLRKQMVHST
jgi:RNA polymerase sigma-70 factor (ECF subfamily)